MSRTLGHKYDWRVTTSDLLLLGGSGGGSGVWLGPRTHQKDSRCWNRAEGSLALLQTSGPPGASDAKQIFDLPPFKWKTAEKILEIIMAVMNIQSSDTRGWRVFQLLFIFQSRVQRQKVKETQPTAVKNRK